MKILSQIQYLYYSCIMVYHYWIMFHSAVLLQCYRTFTLIFNHINVHFWSCWRYTVIIIKSSAQILIMFIPIWVWLSSIRISWYIKFYSDFDWVLIESCWYSSLFFIKFYYLILKLPTLDEVLTKFDSDNSEVLFWLWLSYSILILRA